jgi:arabinogalactan oligomer/maltooligosaccharide transport system permease protein
MATQSTASQASTSGAVSTLPAVQTKASDKAIAVSLRRRNQRWGLILSYLILVIAVIFAVYPVYFAFLVSIRPNGQLLAVDLPGMFFPTTGISFDSYKTMMFGNQPFFSWLGNSLFISISTSVASVLLATSAAFAISRIRFLGRNLLLILFLAIQAFPGVLALSAITNLLTKLGLYGNPLGLILAYSAGSLVFSTWNLKGYFDTIPIDIEEAAMMDGCNTLQSFIRVLIPLSVPAIAITALFGFLAGWGEFALASAIIPSPTARQTLPVALRALSASNSVPWGLFAAGSILVAIPTMLLFLYMQRYLQSGLTLGGVK